jgi:hypothetical protein
MCWLGCPDDSRMQAGRRSRSGMLSIRPQERGERLTAQSPSAPSGWHVPASSSCCSRSSPDRVGLLGDALQMRSSSTETAHPRQFRTGNQPAVAVIHPNSDVIRMPTSCLHNGEMTSLKAWQNTL